MINRIIKFFIFFFKKQARSLKEIKSLIEKENNGFEKAFSNYIDNIEKEKELFNFLLSDKSKNPNNILDFLDEFANDFISEISNFHLETMFNLRFDLLCLSKEEYFELIEYIASIKDKLTIHMNDKITAKITSLADSAQLSKVMSLMESSYDENQIH